MLSMYFQASSLARKNCTMCDGTGTYNSAVGMVLCICIIPFYAGQFNFREINCGCHLFLSKDGKYVCDKCFIRYMFYLVDRQIWKLSSTHHTKD